MPGQSWWIRTDSTFSRPQFSGPHSASAAGTEVWTTCSGARGLAIEFNVLQLRWISKSNYKVIEFNILLYIKKDKKIHMMTHPYIYGNVI